MDVQETTEDVLMEFDLSELQVPPARIDGVVLGCVEGIGEGGWPLVNFSGNPTDDPLMAVSTKTVTEVDTGRAVALQFLKGDPTQPVIVGFLWNPRETGVQQGIGITSDGERIELNAKKEIVLKCGKSSITLTRAGKIIIRGKYVLSRSSGVNRIKGGSVQIN